MSYYKKEKNRRSKNAVNNYCPPKTYKNNKPIKEEFEIKNTDIDLIEKEYISFEKKKNTIEIIISGTWFILGSVPCGYFAAYIANEFNLNDNSLLGFIPIIVFFILYFIGFAIVGLLTAFIKYSKIGEYEKIKKYKSALNEYYWWQERKKKDFWYSLNGRKFEIEISNIFKKLGYKTKICKQGGDEGVDLEIEKDGNKEIIQCKAHKSKISPSVARDLLGTMINKKVNHAYLITLYGGTAGTIDFCKKNNITLWDINDIIKYNEMD